MKYKQIIPCIRLKDRNIDPEDILQMDNIGADGVLLIEESNTVGEEFIIKLIKSVCDRSDISLTVQRHYQRLEDVKKFFMPGHPMWLWMWFPERIFI